MKKDGFKMFVKKFTACVLAAVMTVSTPLTAFAAEFSDNFSQSDGTDGSNSKSETVSSTQSDTNTNSTVLGEDAEKITGFMIYGYDQNDTITMTPGNKKTLTAAILVSGSLKDVTMADLNKNIKWNSSAPSIVSVNTMPESMNKCELKAENAGNATITASYNDYSVVINVKVIDPSQIGIGWDVTDTFYVKHTYCLSDYLWFNDGSGKIRLGDATTDVVTFAVKASPKVATISGDMLTIKGVGTVTLSAVLPDGTERLSGEITTDAGSPVKKMTASDPKVELDFADSEKTGISNPSTPVSVEVTTTDDATTTTDDIIWTSSNESVARVIPDPDYSDNKTKAVIMATDGIGKATITAKATSGKTAKFNVTVKATLISINSVSISGSCAWSGKTEELIIDRTPEQNRDKFKVTVGNDYKKLVKTKSTANSATITPVNDLKLAEGQEGIEVTLTVAPSDKNLVDLAKEATITVMQSDVEIDKVFPLGEDPATAKDMNKQTVRTNPEENYSYETILKDKHNTPGDCAVSWVSSNVKVATIDNGNLKVVGQGTAKITVSSVYKDGKKYKQSKKTFTVKSTPECDGIELKSNTAAYDLSKKKSVTINVKQQLPKKANDEIEWYVNGVKQPTSKNATDKKLTILPTNAAFSGVQPNTTVEVMAVSKMDSSVYAVATIYVVKPAAKKVAFSDKYKKGVTLSVGGITDPDIEVPTITGSQNDPIVSYTVDKKGVGVVKAEMTEGGDLKLIGVGEGKATVTALTASGKKGTIKVEVKGGQSSSKK